MKIFGREPTLIIGTLASVLTAVVPLGFEGLSAGQVAAVIVVLNAALGVVNAIAVRPVSPAAFTYGITALAGLLAAYGLELSPETTAAVSAAVVAILTLITRGSVTPTSDPAPTAPAEGPVR